MNQPSSSSVVGAALRARLAELWERTGDAALGELAAGRPPRPGASVATPQEVADWTSTCLMAVYQRTRDDAVLALLFECNRESFLQAIQQGLRRTWLRVDPQDVLQEVFLNICRYPTRFDADKVDAFRNWGHRIVRNTLLRLLKGQARHARLVSIDEETFQPEDRNQPRPDRAASEAEDSADLDRTYVLYLQLYLFHFAQLSARERRVLTMVEIDGMPYRDAAAALGIRPENLKMVVFRGRQKIQRAMAQHLAPAARDVQPAAPRAASAPPHRGAIRSGDLAADAT
ncbi:MAG: RNA polymerase sigma factor [Planctomycetota bacterium]